jgi:beta-hydroxylase
MFYSCDRFPELKILEDNWSDILGELTSKTVKNYQHWPEPHIYDGVWVLCDLIAAGRVNTENVKHFPKTMALLQQIPGLATAAFSALAPGTVIKPHTGFTDTVLRAHLGLMCPEGCAIRVGGETKTWEEGKCLVFDDTVEHEVYNKSGKARVVLLMDIAKDLSVGAQYPSYVEVFLQNQ